MQMMQILGKTGENIETTEEKYMWMARLQEVNSVTTLFEERRTICDVHIGFCQGRYVEAHTIRILRQRAPRFP